jgi:hypothetical protein
MKTSLMLPVLLACSIKYSSSFAQEEKPATQAPPSKENKTQKATAGSAGAEEQKAAMEKAWGEFMTPGDLHKMMASYNGEWKEEITMWMEPGAPPVVSAGSCMNVMVLDGRYQVSVHTNTFQGMPFEGRGLWGYNNATKKFESTWIDNMGTGIMYMEGTWNEKTRTITFKGKSVDIMTGKTTLMRELYKLIDDNNQSIEMYETKDGKETKIMAIKLTR